MKNIQVPIGSKFISVLLVIMLTIGVPLQAFAHSMELDVSYDECWSEENADGVYEMWYSLHSDGTCRHLSDTDKTIEFYFSRDETEWIKLVKQSISYEITDEQALDIVNEIKRNFSDSMKKWNDVYYYSYDSYGNMTKHKIINIIEVESSNGANLTICPDINDSSNGVIASTLARGGNVTIESGDKIHRHTSRWTITIYLNQFIDNGANSNAVNYARLVAGAHEIGHILGLEDIDKNNYCNAYSEVEYDEGNPTSFYHHGELLMGYDIDSYSSKDITYKDIAGVAITRGFHTDDDHKWLLAYGNDDGTLKIICSICSGTRDVFLENLEEYTYEIFGSCNIEHDLSSQNMMAVASCGDYDYYKCKYCKYVAPLSNIVEQDYTFIDENSSYHKGINNVQGLEYEFYEEHTFELYSLLDQGQHIVTCICGATIDEDHNFLISQSVSLTHHNSICVCGECVTVEHCFEYSQIYDNNYHKKVCDCGEFVFEPHNFVDQYCLDCGEHTHSFTNGYEDFSSNLHVAYCACGELTLEEHIVENHQCVICLYFIHIYSHDYISINDSQHYAYCECGEAQIELHNMFEESCVECGYHEHQYTYRYESNSASSHKSYCICGEYIAEAHNLQDFDCIICGYHMHSYTYRYELELNNKHKAFCVCGASIIEDHTIINHECTKCKLRNHSYTYTSIDESTHSIICDCGINIVEDHDMQNGICADCGYHVHSYTHHYEYKSALQHYSYCICGDSITQRHAIKQSDGGGMTVSICEYCSAMISGPGVLDGIYTDLPHTENGSYILPNGIIVLVPEDEEAYLNGTLEFRTGEVM